MTKNAMKPPAEEPAQEHKIEGVDETVFESEDVVKAAVEASDEYGIDLNELKGTGENGVVTEEDVLKAVEAAEKPDEGETDVDFASETAGEFYAENKDKIDLSKVKGTGKNGAITKGDLQKALPKDKEPEETEEESEEDEGETELDYNNPDDVAGEIERVLDDVTSFIIPVRGALNTKPKVQASWNDLAKRVVKLNKAHKKLLADA